VRRGGAGATQLFATLLTADGAELARHRGPWPTPEDRRAVPAQAARVVGGLAGNSPGQPGAASGPGPRSPEMDATRHARARVLAGHPAGSGALFSAGPLRVVSSLSPRVLLHTPPAPEAAAAAAMVGVLVVAALVPAVVAGWVLLVPLAGLTGLAMGRWEPHAGEPPRLIVVEETTQPGQWTLHALDIQGGVTRSEVAHTLDTRQSWTSSTVTLETQRPDGMAWITVHGISASGARAHRMFLWPSPDKAPALVGEFNEGNGQTYTWDAPMVPVDLDGDGATELVDVTFETLSILRPPQADEQGTQVVLEMPLTLASSPTQVTTGDFDGDGDGDVRVLQESCHDTLLENQDGRLVQRNTTLTYMDPTLSSVRADLTGDGRPELLLLGTQDGLVNVLGLGAQGEVVSQSSHRLVKASPSEGSQEGPRVGRVLHRLMDMEKVRAAPPALYQHDRVHVGRGTLDPATVVALVANDGAVLVLQSR
jgi:hypothetical protein